MLSYLYLLQCFVVYFFLYTVAPKLFLNFKTQLWLKYYEIYVLIHISLLPNVYIGEVQYRIFYSSFCIDDKRIHNGITIAFVGAYIHYNFIIFLEPYFVSITWLENMNLKCTALGRLCYLYATDGSTY